MRILKAADYRRMPWKNGKGTTSEVLIEPPGVGLEAFDWRVSLAQVVEDGAFSSFPGIDRTLAVLSGGPLVLTVDAGAPVRLTAGAAPLPFAADVPCRAILAGPPVVDLNVMTRRGRAWHRLTAVSVGPLTVAAPVALLVAQSATLRGVADEVAFELEAEDAALLEGAACRILEGRGYLIEIGASTISP